MMAPLDSGTSRAACPIETDNARRIPQKTARGTTRTGTVLISSVETQRSSLMTTQLSLSRRRVVPIVIGALVVAGGWLIRAQDETRSGEWRSSGGDSAYRRYSPLAQITRDNVKNLRIVWRRPALDPRVKEAFPKLRTNNYLRATPTMIGGVLYTPDAAGLITALDAATGDVLWRQEPTPEMANEASATSTRGVDFWKGGADHRLFT